MNTLNDPNKQDRGSADPTPGRCGAKLRNSDPPRYCCVHPIKGSNRCRRHGGKSLVGPASKNWKTGRASKYSAVLPQGLREHFDLSKLEEAASCREELALVDARTAEVLSNITAGKPTGVTISFRAALGVVLMELDRENLQGVKRGYEALAAIVEQQALINNAWDEVHRLLATRAKLSQAELAWQKLLSERILIEHIDAFIQALIAEAKSLTDDKQKLSAYVRRVQELGSGAIGHSLLPDTVDAEIVEGEQS